MIYFDNAATTIPIGYVNAFYNPSSPHFLGIKAERALRLARSQLAKLLEMGGSQSFGLTPSTSNGDIIFTSGGTESNNLAILGFVLANSRHVPTLVCAPYEHPSLVKPVCFACQRSWSREADEIPSSGKCLLVLSHVNHETGDIYDVNGIASSIKQKNPEALVLVDGAQGFSKEKSDLCNIDIYSFSGHKFHSPSGVGGLWVRKGVRILPLLHGGEQESALRSGSENVSGIVQMTEVASQLFHNLEHNHAHAAKIKAIISSLTLELPDVTVNTTSKNISPYILNMSFLGVKGEILVHALSEKKLYVSMGAACRSRSAKKSALELMRFSRGIYDSAIRFSFSHLNTIEEANVALELIADQVRKLRKMKG